MPTIIEFPEIGEVEFPDSMDEAAIEAASKRLYAEEVVGPRRERLQRQGARARNEARAIDLVGRALDVQTEFTQGATPGGLATAAGKALGYAGNVVAGAAEDVIAGEASPTSLGNIPNPIGPRFTAALMGQEPPRSAADSPLEQGVVDAARTLPMVAAGMVGSAAGLPVPAAFGAPMAVSAWHESRTQGASEGQSLLAGAQAGVTGAIIPGIAKAGASAAAKAMGAAVNQGWLSGSRTLAQKGAEVLAGQGAVQVFMEGLNLPTYLEATPEERKAMLIRSMAANVAFLAMDVPGLVSRQPSVTQQGLGPKAVASAGAAEVIQRAIQDPVAIDALLEAADRFALDRLSGAEWAREWVPGRRDGPGVYRPGTADSAPLPAQPEAIAEQIRLTEDPESTRAVTLVTPSEQAPEVPAGLDAVETPHGVAVFNPEKISRDEVVAAGEGERFDATVLGMADDGRVPVASDTVVTTRTPAAADVATEVVSNTPEAIAKATEAQQASVPGGVTEVVPARVLAETRQAPAADTGLPAAAGWYVEPESDRYVIRSTKDEFKRLPTETQRLVAKYFLFSPRRGGWVSRASKAAEGKYGSNASYVLRKLGWPQIDAIAAPPKPPKDATTPTRTTPAEPPRFQAPEAIVASAPEGASAGDWLTVPIVDDTEAKAFKQAVGPRMEALRVELDGARRNLKEVEAKVISQRGPRWSRGKIKASAKPQDIEVYRKLQNRIGQMEQETEALQAAGIRDADQTIERASLIRKINDPSERPVRRMALRSRLFADSGETAPEALAKGLEAEATQEILQRYPDANEVEIRKLIPGVIKNAMAGTAESFDGAWKVDPELNLSWMRAQELRAEWGYTTEIGNQWHQLLPDEVATAYRSNDRGPFTRAQVDQFKAAFDQAKDTLRTQQQQERAAAEAEAAQSAEVERQVLADHQRLVAEAEAEAADQTTKRKATEIKTELVSRLEAALAEAPEKVGEGGKPLHVVIAVPGDGVFLLKNTQEALAKTLKGAKSMATDPGGQDTGKPAWRRVPKPTGNITPELFLDSSEPTHLVAYRTADGMATTPGKAVRFQVPGFGGETFWLIAWPTQENFHVTEPKTGLRVGAGPTMRKALDDADAKLQSVGRDKFEAAIAGHLEGRDPLPEPTVLERVSPAPTSSGPSGSARGRAEAYGPGGPLGAEPAQPADNPNFSAFPMELPEAVRFARDLMQGAYPKVREALRILKGKALGVFRSDGLGSAEIELRADIFDLLSRDDKAKLQQEAEEYAARVSDFPDEAAGIARDRYEYLLKQAYDEAKVRNPVAALKTLWHEIGHLVDWLPDHMIQGRGNLLGRIASLKNYLRHTLPMEPGGADRPVTPAERERLRREAEKQLREELGPIREIIETVLVEEPIYRTTGVTPDQVKALFGMDARESMPDLYAWFVSQPAETKKDIVRKAMKGIVDDRLASITTQEQIGTRKTERVVRKVSGREPTQAEIVARFRDLLRKEMAARRMADLETLKSELRPMIAWWRGTAEMEDYFKPSPEMYAEAFSVFMNNPAAVARRAPTYYRLMHSYMERKPAVQAVYDQIQDQIKSGTIMRERVGDLRATWRKDNETSVERMVQRLRTRGRDLLDNILYHVDRRFGPVYRAAAGTSRDPAIRKAVGDFTYRAAEHERFLGRINDRVGSLLMANNLDWNDLGEYLFHQRIIQERFNMANPLGWTSKNSLERVAEMKATLGPTAFGRLEEAAARFRKQYEDQVLPLMREARLWGPELQQKIDANVWYATFAAVQGLPDSGIERALQLSYGSSVTPHIYRQIGMLGEIKNPATATVLKALSLMSAAHRNIAKREIVTMLRTSHPEEIREAERRWTGKGWEPVDRQTDRVGTITYLEDGKPLSFYVPRLMADAVNGGAAVENRLAGAMMRAQSWQKGLFTQLNYGFWPVNFMRDSLDWWLKMPGVGTPAAWVARLPRAIAAARSSVKGRPNPVADDALRRLMLIAREDPSGVLGDAADEFEAKVASYGMNPVQWDKTLQGGRLAIGIWNRYRELGQTMERVNKIAGMLYLDEKFPDLPEWKKREMVRERAGSPDFMQRGAWKGGLEFAFLFYNAWKQGVRATVNAARDNPWSFAAKAGAGVAVPSVLMAAAARGIFGDDLEEAFRSIPDYDLTNYLVVPLQWADRPNGKVMYLRLPLPDPMRLMHGTLFKTLTDRGEGYAAFWGGQVPGLNPLLQVAGAWSMYAMGNNPPDLHTGRPILDDTTFAAGGAPATAEMGKWTWNSLGGGIIHRFRNAQLDAPPTTETERLLAAPGVANVMGRWIKVSNRGLMDEDRRQTKDLEQYRAQARLAVRSLLNRWADAGLLEGVLQPMAAGDATTAARRIIETEMSPAERRLLREPYAMEHLLRTLPEVMRSRSSTLMQRVQRAPSKDAKVMILSNEVQRATGGR